MADEAAFERLATAVLRESRAAYASLLHPGINVADKTVKSPLDGIAFVTGARPRHFIAAHHTTSRREHLEKKWLHDPAITKSRRGGHLTIPMGDLTKTALIVAAERKHDPELRATLILTTNREPREDLVRKTHATGKSCGIEVDIWSVSRLAHFLDNTPSGQWLRRQFFGIEQQLLSRELLEKLSRDSLVVHLPANDKNAWVSTSLDTQISKAVEEQDAIFIIAESGLGKSVACYKHLTRHIETGGFGLVLTHDVVSSSLTVEEAVEKTLRRLHPTLVNGAGVDALTLSSAGRPLTLVVEDINKSGQATLLLERLAKWGSHGRVDDVTEPLNRSIGQRRKLLCPVWPQIVSSLSDANNKLINSMAVI